MKIVTTVKARSVGLSNAQGRPSHYRLRNCILSLCLVGPWVPRVDCFLPFAVDGADEPFLDRPAEIHRVTNLPRIMPSILHGIGMRGSCLF